MFKSKIKVAAKKGLEDGFETWHKKTKEKGY